MDNLGNTGLYRHEPGLHRKCCVVNRELTGARFSIDLGHTGAMSALCERTLLFRNSLSVHHGMPAVIHWGVPGPYRHYDKEEIMSLIYV